MTTFDTLHDDIVADTKRQTERWPSRAVSLLRRLPPSLVFSWLILATVFLWAVAPSLFTGYNPLEGVGGAQLKRPSAEHLLGTDALGRDLYARIVHGAVHSLTGAFVAVGLGLIVGTGLGVVAGSVRRRFDDAIMRLVDVFLSIPPLLLSLSIIILLGAELAYAIAKERRHISPEDEMPVIDKPGEQPSQKFAPQVGHGKQAADSKLEHE